MFQCGKREQALGRLEEHNGVAAQQIAQAHRRYRGGLEFGHSNVKY